MSVDDFANLLRLKLQQLQAQFPYNRNGDGRDDYSYYRVRPTLLAFIDFVQSHVTQHSSHGEGDAWQVLTVSADFASQLPEFDTQEFNHSGKLQLLKFISRQCAVMANRGAAMNATLDDVCKRYPKEFAVLMAARAQQ